jgi:hypothetical protein
MKNPLNLFYLAALLGYAAIRIVAWNTTSSSSDIIVFHAEFFSVYGGFFLILPIHMLFLSTSHGTLFRVSTYTYRFSSLFRLQFARMGYAFLDCLIFATVLECLFFLASRIVGLEIADSAGIDLFAQYGRLLIGLYLVGSLQFLGINLSLKPWISFLVLQSWLLTEYLSFIGFIPISLNLILNGTFGFQDSFQSGYMLAVLYRPICLLMMGSIFVNYLSILVVKGADVE